ncbi:hypothetical protein Pfo_007149 [Paulownia fortunei]|nr:hypothetical protein Pfo_007149 [Paulownia fortunei]
MNNGQNLALTNRLLFLPLPPSAVFFNITINLKKIHTIYTQAQTVSGRYIVSKASPFVLRFFDCVSRLPAFHFHLREEKRIVYLLKF